MDSRQGEQIREVICALQLAKIYPQEHPQFQESVKKAYSCIYQLLSQKDAITIGIVGEELAFEKEVFFDLSKAVKPLIRFLKERGVEKIVFARGVKEEELREFILFLVAPKDKIGEDAQGYLAQRGVTNLSVGKIKASFAEDVLRKSVNYLRQYEHSIERVTDGMNSLLNNETFEYLDLREAITAIMENILCGYTEFLKLATIKKHDVNTFVHLIDVSILSMYFSHKLGFKKADVLDIGLAALFHDIGKIYISRRIIDKPDKLSDEEFGLMKSHTVMGASILLKYTDKLGILPAVVAFEHHMRYDAKGYPKPFFPLQPHIASLIISLCDVYDALNARRSYKRRYSPDMIYKLMMEEKARAFDPELLEKLFRVLGAWPIGAIVALNDGRIAVVREINEDDISFPKVEVIFPQKDKECIDLKERKNELTIERALDPLAEGKEYLPLI